MPTRVLLVYPEFPVTYWSYRYALPFLGKKSSMPPLGLLTVAAMLPDDFQVRLVDMNVQALRESDILEADLVMTSSMMVQKKSLQEVIGMCNRLQRPVVAGGPYPTSCYQNIPGVDYFVLNEAEVTLPHFIEDFRRGRARPVYYDDAKPDITGTPPPRLDILDLSNYATMALQYSRGCPFNCEFCDIIELFGRVPRTKTPEQFLREMELLYQQDYRGSLFIVDDNFIGNKRNVKQLLPAIADWQKAHRYPFTLFTEASVNLASDDELLKMMEDAGFNMVFLGIETPVKESLALTQKKQNLKKDLMECVHKIQQHGMEVTGGFIIGFDNDPEDIFDRQIQFIQEAGIPTAMVGLLTAAPNTQLYRRLERENRLLTESTGNNTHELILNFIPRMDAEKVIEGYKRVIAELYKPVVYFQRCLTYLRNLRPHRHSTRKITWMDIRALVASLVRQTFSSYGWYYWRFILKSLLTKPVLFSESITLAIKGHHYFRITQEILAVDNFKMKLEKLSADFAETINRLFQTDLETKLDDVLAYRDRILRDVKKEYRRLHKDFRHSVDEALNNFETAIDQWLLEKTPAVQAVGTAHRVKKTF